MYNRKEAKEPNKKKISEPDALSVTFPVALIMSFFPKCHNSHPQGAYSSVHYIYKFEIFSLNAFSYYKIILNLST